MRKYLSSDHVSADGTLLGRAVVIIVSVVIDTVTFRATTLTSTARREAVAITGIDHIVIRVRDLEAATVSFQALGMELTRTGVNPVVGKQAFFRLSDGFFFELVEPLTPDSPVGQALERGARESTAWRWRSTTMPPPETL